MLEEKDFQLRAMARGMKSAGMTLEAIAEVTGVCHWRMWRN